MLATAVNNSWEPINHRRFFFRNKTLPSFRNPRIFSLSDFIEFNFDSSFYIVSVTHLRYFNLVKPFFVFHKMKILARLLCFTRFSKKLALITRCVRIILVRLNTQSPQSHFNTQFLLTCHFSVYLYSGL